MNESIYYVYLHVHPRTHEVVYVGKGVYGRAWDVTRNRNGHPEHLAWMKEQASQGYLPTEWVQIWKRELTEQEAFAEEKNYLHTHGTKKFNRQSGERNFQAKLTDEQAREIYLLCQDQVYTHQQLADKYGVSRAAISMIASRKQWRAATACLV